METAQQHLEAEHDSILTDDFYEYVEKEHSAVGILNFLIEYELIDLSAVIEAFKESGDYIDPIQWQKDQEAEEREATNAIHKRW